MSRWSAPLALLGGALLGSLATGGTEWLLLLGGVIATVWLIVLAPPRAVVWVAGAGVLVSQGNWLVVTSVLGGDFYLGDLLALSGIVAALARARSGTWWSAPFALVGVLVAWAVLRSGPAGEISFARIMMPLVVLLVVARILPEGHDLRRDLRWFPVAALISVPLLEGAVLSRWSSIAGGPNETGLIAATAIVVGFTYSGPWRYALWTLGAALLAGTAAITATIAAGAGAVYYAVARRRPAGRRLGSGSPLLIVTGIGLAVVMIKLLRVDLYSTIDAHLFQISKVDRVLKSGDAVFGSGWANADRAAFYDSDISGLHNVYLDFLAQLGAVGLLLLLVLLVLAWNRADVVGRALLITWVVWVNTSGAFPGSAWGVLGFVQAFAVLSNSAPERGRSQTVRGAGPHNPGVDLDQIASRN